MQESVCHVMAAALAALLALQVDVSVRVRFAPDTALAADTGSAALDSATLATAYLDPGARELVRRARERRETLDRSIRGYEALVRERVSVGVTALRRERLLFRRETAARIRWRQFGASEATVLGARDAIPIVSSRVRLPDDLDAYIPHLVFDPANDRFLVGLDDSDFIRHPLARGSEADYRFASGDTTVLRLPDGRSVRLLELRFIPRRRDSRLLRGAFRLEAETHAVVQAHLRLARAYDYERDADDADDRDDLKEVPGLLKPIRADSRYLTVEYGLWEMRWWLPRLVAFEGYGAAGKLLRAPLRYERLYSAYEVLGDTVALPPVTLALAGDSLDGRCGGRGCWCEDGRCRRVRVHLPGDTASLLGSELLPPSAFEEGTVLLSGQEVREITALLERIPGAPAELERPRVHWGLDRPGLLRYNRVEGLSVGAQVEAEYGGLEGDLTARLGVAELEPNAELGIERETATRIHRLAAYRRLVAADDASRPFTLGNSLSALLYGRDDGDYYRAYGLELSGTRPGAPALAGSWRLYAERQRPAEAMTDFSLRRLFDGNATFRPNLRADGADQVGLSLALRAHRGLDPVGFRWGAELSMDAEAGTFRFLRPAALLRVSMPLPGPLVGSLEGAAGTSFGRLPAQSLWFLGGPTTLRGYDPLVASGPVYWRGRAEAGTAFPGARLTLFADAGWAGSRETLRSGPPLLSAGIGASLLDGLLRLDVARALRAPTGWKAHLYLDAAL